jgi:diaminohydroxyphosphoribosylaminopyrimidine deaminase / 5-amino-6-(5-phosphoribosylamino)uracil reductase
VNDLITVHEKYMNLCFELAKNGAGMVSPNPLVGAVIVKDNKIISTGYHSKYGGAHAEVNAINSAAAGLKGSTLYCNLEPCVHEDKQTPPCVPAIISSGIKKVVIANIDPNPKVSGKGVNKLLENGLEVQTGILDTVGKELNRFFFHFIKTGLPFVTVKIASSADGKFSRSGNEKTWLTGDESRVFVHRLRSIYDSVLVGAGTVNSDNPELTVRTVDGRNPVRIILDGNLNANVDAKVFNDNKSRTIVFCSPENPAESKRKFLKPGVEIIEIEPGTGNRLDIKKILEKLAKLKIISLFVEGGGEIFSQFIEQCLADEVILLTAPIVLEKGIDTVLPPKNDFYFVKKESLGKDSLSLYRKVE